MRLQQYFDEIYRPLRLRGRSPNTSRLYGCTIRAFGKFLRREPTLEDLEEMTLARFLEHRGETRSPYTAEKERSQLMALARLANERRLIAMMPTCEPAPLPERVPHAWSVDEIGRLFDVLSEQTGFIGNVPASIWWPCLFLVCWESGERIGAILDVPRANYRRPFLSFDPESRKGKSRGNLADLSEDTCDRLDAMLALDRGGRTDPLFRWERCRTYLWDQLKSMLKAAGLGGNRVAFHQIRRSAVSHFAKAGGDPVRLAGHAQAATTFRWYVDPQFVDRGPRACDLLPKMLRRKSGVDGRGRGGIVRS